MNSTSSQDDFLPSKEEGFMDMVTQNKATIYKISFLYTNTAEDREDLSQEIIYQLWKSFDRFENRSRLSTWLYRVALNTALYQLKTRKRKIDLSSTMERSDVFVEQGSEDQEKINEMLKAIQRLNVMDRSIVLLYFEEHNHSEIAEILGISTSNVGTRMQRIKKKLKSLMKKEV